MNHQDLADTYDLYNHIIRFIDLYSMYPESVKVAFRELIATQLISITPRNHEAAIGQFLAQLDHIEEQDDE